MKAENVNRGSEGASKKDEGEKKCFGKKREIHVTSSFIGATARHEDKKHMQAAKTEANKGVSMAQITLNIKISG